MLCSIVVQFSFCLLCALTIATSSFDDDAIQGFGMWNDLFANVQPPGTNDSIVKLSCTDSGSGYYRIGSSYHQASSAKHLQEYFGIHQDFNYEFLPVDPGFLMCSLALFCWYVGLVGETRMFMQYMSSLANLTVAPETHITKSSQRGSIKLSTICTTRLYAIYSLSLMRLIMTLWMAHIGTWFIVGTEEIGDMIVASLELHFILDVDKMLFMLASPRVKGLLSELESLPPQTPHKYGTLTVYRPQVLSAIGLLILVIWSTTSVLLPDRDDRKAALDALCEGWL
jgi:hypothetical protein